MPAPRGGKDLAKDLKELRDAGVQVLVSLLPEDQSKELELEHESDSCRENKIEFISFPICDHRVPDSFSEARLLIERLAEIMAGGKTVGIHCWGGIGRAGMIAASILCMEGIAPEKAFSLIQASRGEKVPEMPEQEKWVITFARENGL